MSFSLSVTFFHVISLSPTNCGRRRHHHCGTPCCCSGIEGDIVPDLVGVTSEDLVGDIHISSLGFLLLLTAGNGENLDSIS